MKERTGKPIRRSYMLENYLKEFDKLNEYQKKAVMNRDRYVILNAVVGSGKTTVLTHKVLYVNFIDNVPLEDMVVLTFTNKAAAEIMDRVSGFDEGLVEKMKYFGTFHSVARRILSEHPGLTELGYTGEFNVIDNEEAAKILTEIIEGKKLSIKYRSKLMKRIEEFKRGKHLYGVMKNEDDIGELYDLYKREKLNRDVMDFDDLIENCIKILDKPLNPKWIIVDEFQDTDERQLELISRIAGEDTNVFVIGDPNQVIYSWRTGNSNIFEKFRCLYN
jgi:superfamily I DNA/RNA helicase